MAGYLQSADNTVLMEAVSPAGTTVMGSADAADLSVSILRRDKFHRVAWMVVGELLHDSSWVDITAIVQRHTVGLGCV